jgi:hypothetical protein
MPRTSWAESAGRYRIDIRLGSLDLLLMVDTGLVDPLRRVGFEIEPAIFDRLRNAGNFASMRRRKRTDASGASIVNEVGSTTAQLLEPTSRSTIGPPTQVDVMRGVPGVSSRVGVEFFHRLTACRVVWELDPRRWCVEYP